MMNKYNPKFIEKKWQDFWQENPDLCAAKNSSKGKKRFVLDMFPYPSGEGLHTGHVESYTATDIVSRYHRMKGCNVLHPQGWDAFGLPAENYAIKTQIHPAKTTKKSIQNFKRQMNMMGLSYDWSREVNSSDPDYYKWTQWFFLLLYKNNLAYKKKAKVNWCDSCQTVLANEQVEDGKCERCKNAVRQKDLEQWFFSITKFIEDIPLISRGLRRGYDAENVDAGMHVRTNVRTSGLLSGLDKIDWPESTKMLQRNWIGKSEGVLIKLEIRKTKSETNSKLETKNPKQYLEVFTTRLDTIFGCTYCVVAPEHEIIKKYEEGIKNKAEVEKYLEKTKKKSDLERMEAKEKTGVELKGIKAVNPFTGEEVPVWVADYVLSQYGTGAVMAVPAHDERDYEFAKKYNLPIKKVIEPCFWQTVEPGKIRDDKPFIERDAVLAIVKHWKDEKYLGLNWKNVAWKTFITGGPENGQNFEEAARTEVLEETGYKNLKLIKTLPMVHAKFYHVPKDLNRFAHFHSFYFELENDEQMKVVEKEKSLHEAIWLSKEEIEKIITSDSQKYAFKMLKGMDDIYVDDGVLVDSGEYSGLTSSEAREKMTKWLEKNKLGEKKINYKLRDWLVSRQRYWGAPIPIIYCRKCWENPKSELQNSKQIKNLKQEKFKTTLIDGKKYAVIPVPEKDLPVRLPTDVDFLPTGESPLKYSKSFQNVKCPKCGGRAKRESDTMDTFVCSSWYYFRYADPKNEKEFASRKSIEKWLPVDLYVGGAEHSVLHLLYSRFFTKVLHNLGYINFDEPFSKLRHQGIILAEDGRKMSKSLGNVVNPDDEVKRWGADALRCFEMFMGPLEDSKPWNTKGIVGVYRFLEKVWRLQYRVESSKYKVESKISNNKSQISNKFQGSNDQNSKCNSLVHKTIKKVTEDIENMRFNTAISSLMILANRLEKENQVGLSHYSCFLLLLSPFAPHLSEDLWSRLGHKGSIFKEKWPEYAPELIKDDEIELVIQVNGKVRDKILVDADISEEKAKKVAMESEKVRNHIAEKKIKKVIFVKGRLVNVVTSS